MEFLVSIPNHHSMIICVITFESAVCNILRNYSGFKIHHIWEKKTKLNKREENRKNDFAIASYNLTVYHKKGVPKKTSLHRMNRNGKTHNEMMLRLMNEESRK